MNVRRITLLLLLTIQTVVSAKHIIFDLGDVLVKQSKFGIARRIGLSSLTLYAITHQQTPDKLKTMAFEILEMLGNQEPVDELFATYDGNPLPRIMCRWLVGNIEGYEIITAASRKIEELAQDNYFASNREIDLLKKVIEQMFDPKTLAQNTYILPDACTLLKRLSDLGHDLYILSNWDPASFKLLSRRSEMKPLFDFFPSGHTFISGMLHMIKPHSTIYTKLLNTFELDPADCIFIDDQASNIIGAQRCGIPSIHFRGSFKELASHLNKLI